MVRFSLVAVIWLGAPLFAREPVQPSVSGLGAKVALRPDDYIALRWRWLQEMVPIRWMTR
jgi:hypothetical protein